MLGQLGGTKAETGGRKSCLLLVFYIYRKEKRKGEEREESTATL